MISDIEHFLKYLLALCLFKRNICLDNLPTLKSDYLFSAVELFEFLICSGCQSWQVNSLPTFFKFCMLSFHACFLFCASPLATSLKERSDTSLFHSFSSFIMCSKYMCVHPGRALLHFVQEAIDMYIWSCLPNGYEQKHTFKR